MKGPGAGAPGLFFIGHATKAPKVAVFWPSVPHVNNMLTKIAQSLFIRGCNTNLFLDRQNPISSKDGQGPTGEDQDAEPEQPASDNVEEAGEPA